MKNFLPYIGRAPVGWSPVNRPLFIGGFGRHYSVRRFGHTTWVLRHTDPLNPLAMRNVATFRDYKVAGVAAVGLAAATGWGARKAYLHHKQRGHSHRPPQLTHSQRVMIASKRRRVQGRFA